MKSEENKKIVLAYHEAFYRNDRNTIRALLADKGVFAGPINTFTDADAFLDSAAVFMRLNKKTEIKKVLADESDVAVFYDSTTIVPSIPTQPIASWFKIKHEKIIFFLVHFDPSPFVKAKQNGDIENALRTLEK